MAATSHQTHLLATLDSTFLLDLSTFFFTVLLKHFSNDAVNNNNRLSIIEEA
jgi:hypothetical protein